MTGSLCAYTGVLAWEFEAIVHSYFFLESGFDSNTLSSAVSSHGNSGMLAPCENRIQLDRIEGFVLPLIAPHLRVELSRRESDGCVHRLCSLNATISHRGGGGGLPRRGSPPGCGNDQFGLASHRVSVSV